MDIQTALDGLTVKEQINLIDKENFSGGDIEEACFWSIGVFAWVYFPEIVRKPFGKRGVYCRPVIAENYRLRYPLS